MFFEEILKTAESRDNFMKGLVCLAKADGVISEEESQYFIEAAYNMGLSEGQVEEIKNCMESKERIQVSFDSMAEKALFFREAIQLCAIDVAYTKEEREEIQRLADMMDVDKALIQEIEAWVMEGMDWKKRGDELVNRYI